MAKPSMEEVAERAGVSVAVVRAVLAPPPGGGLRVRRDVAERVRRLAGRLDDGETAGKAAPPPDVVRLCAPRLGDDPLAAALLAELGKRGIPTLPTGPETTGAGPLLFCELGGGAPEGVLLERNTALCGTVGAPEEASVFAPDYAGLYRAFALMARQGRFDVALFLHRPSQTVQAEGFRAAAGEVKRLEGDTLADPAPDAPMETATVAGIRDRARRGSVAVLCADDWLAFRAAQALQAAGLRVPEDIAVAGCGSGPVARRLLPRLTSFDLASVLPRLAAKAAEWAASAMAGAPTPKQRVRVAPKLVVRATFVPTGLTDDLRADVVKG